MTRKIPFLVILILGLSCNSGNNTEVNVTSSDGKNVKIKENARFDFTAERINTFKETIEIKASLLNDNADTIYFLSSSCYGEQYSLRYDTSNFVLTPFINCNASFPVVLKIAPKAQHDFQAHFRYGSKETKIRLGFDFYSVDKSVDLNKLAIADIHGRQEKEQTIIWADEKTIK